MGQGKTMPLFKSWLAGLSSIGTPADTDEVYFRDQSGNVSTRSTWANLKTALESTFAKLSGATFTGNVEIAKAAPQLRLNDTAGTLTGQILNTANDLYIRPAGGSSYFIMEMDTGVIRMANASVVTVPDGSADGHAIAYDQAAARLQTLILDTNFPDLSLWSDSAGYLRFKTAAGVARYDIYHSISTGRLHITQRNASGVFERNVLEVLPDGTFALTGSTAVTVPDATADGHAVAAADVDGTLGQLQLQGGYEVGDTGWRDVSSLLVNSWTATNLRMKRDKNVVYLNGFTVSAASATDDEFLSAIPAGFRPSYTIYDRGIVASSSSYAGYMLVTNAGTADIVSRSTLSFFFTVSWPTDDAWPASLPGTAA